MVSEISLFAVAPIILQGVDTRLVDFITIVQELLAFIHLAEKKT